MNANEPAFPLEFSSPSSGPERYYGLTKREYFSVRALQGFLACPDIEGNPEYLAKGAVVHADALLAELARTEPKEGK